MARVNYWRVAAIVNVRESSIAREADCILPTLAGPEIGVASTKAFTCQLAVLAAIALAAGRQRGVLGREDEEKAVRALSEVPRLMIHSLRLEPQLEAVAREIVSARRVSVSRLRRKLRMRRATSIARRRAVVVIHAAGRGGTPSSGQRWSAAANASWIASSASAKSPVTRMRTARICERS